jgi:hypothetical protein
LKQPSERRKYSFIFDNLMDEDAGEVITEIKSITSEIVGGGTSDLSITGTGIAGAVTLEVDGEDAAYRSGVVVECWIASGTDGNKYRVEALVETDAGQILEADGLLKIKNT